MFSAALTAAAAAHTHTCVRELLIPFISQSTITVEQERAVAPVLQLLHADHARHLLSLLFQARTLRHSPCFRVCGRPSQAMILCYICALHQSECFS